MSPHTKCENTALSFFVPPPYISNYMIQKSISYIEKISGLCNPEANHTSEKKRLSDYIIRKLILCIEKTFGLCNAEVNHKRLLDYIIRS